jgi:DNA gyrase subunit A
MVLPLPEDERQWEKLNVVFATKSGDVRRNELSDFTSIHRSGKIAMKLSRGDGIVGVQTCTERDDIFLSTRAGKCIRFAVSDVRVFKGRDSTGVRGIKLASGDEVVSLSLLMHSDATTAEARAYLKQSSAMRRALNGEESETQSEEVEEEEENGEEATLTAERYAALGAREQFVFAASESGYGKRTSSYEYRVTGRGGSGIVALDMGRKNTAMVGAFPIEESDDLMLISDQGRIIRVAASSVSIQRRGSGGVTVFRVEAGERVVSVERIEETSGTAADERG